MILTLLVMSLAVTLGFEVGMVVGRRSVDEASHKAMTR